MTEKQGNTFHILGMGGLFVFTLLWLYLDLSNPVAWPHCFLETWKYEKKKNGSLHYPQSLLIAPFQTDYREKTWKYNCDYFLPRILSLAGIGNDYSYIFISDVLFSLNSSITVFATDFPFFLNPSILSESTSSILFVLGNNFPRGYSWDLFLTTVLFYIECGWKTTPRLSDKLHF